MYINLSFRSIVSFCYSKVFWIFFPNPDFTLLCHDSYYTHMIYMEHRFPENWNILIQLLKFYDQEKCLETIYRIFIMIRTISLDLKNCNNYFSFSFYAFLYFQLKKWTDFILYIIQLNYNYLISFSKSCLICVCNEMICFLY